MGRAGIGDVVAERFARLDGVAEVEAEPDARVHDLLVDVLDVVEVLRGGEDGASV
jgi:hypothetical protein